MTTADDTFRILARKPIREAYEEIQKKIVFGFVKTEKEFHELVNSYGYTYNEYISYDNTINF